MTHREESFRALLDARGVLLPGALPPPSLRAAFAVFAQRTDAALDLPALTAQASRFFSAKLGATVEKSYGGHAPRIDAARIVLHKAEPEISGTRLCFGRPATADDHARADAAERAQQTHGMALLARRCETVWLVVQEADDDRVALTIAAIFASSMLGPILSPSGDALFGVRTARMKLEGHPRPYR